MPVAAHGEIKNQEILLKASIASKDGEILLKSEGAGIDPFKLGKSIANKLLNEEGGRLLLNENM